MARQGLIPGRRRPARGGMARPRARRGDRWRRAAAWAGAVLLLAALALGVRWLGTAAMFRVARIETSRYRFTVRDSLEARLAPELGRNIWRCDTRALRADVEALPWVARARVGRRLPATLTVAVDEHRPRLLLPSPRGAALSALVDDGSVLAMPPAAPVPDLPHFVDDGGGAADTPAVREALGALLDAVDARDLDRRLGVDYVLHEPRGFVLLLTGSRTRLLLGREDFAERLRRYEAVAADAPPGALVDLRFDGQVFLRDPDDA
ncbi:MAG TPA: FtsQ-type POTRA domain-containing protein [Candidatus Krumholzibacteria bacterium]|mgnify:CR=1 FL=1|nr:FtsQ-type POTRA domain-containing protein [Candidatus Krumholzibacteria bacterium]HRX50040.1 FtsQ-type POTRA domain-containing protein [Candidatus Krumholzibacteria bacterium]